MLTRTVKDCSFQQTDDDFLLRTNIAIVVPALQLLPRPRSPHPTLLTICNISRGKTRFGHTLDWRIGLAR